MSNISRRKFLKGAGVAALAVAAAGVLAGCSGSASNNDKTTPSTGDDRPVTLYYIDKTKGKILGTVEISVPALTKNVSFTTIQEKKPAAAEGYDFVSTEDAPISANGSVSIKMVPSPTTKPVTFVYKQHTADKDVIVEVKDAKTDDVVAIDAKTVSTKGLIPGTSDWEAINETESIGADNIVTVYVKKKGTGAAN